MRTQHVIEEPVIAPWKPAPGVVWHNGEPVASDRIFPIQPPMCIGELRSVFSNIPPNQLKISAREICVLWTIVLGIAYLGSWGLVRIQSPPHPIHYYAGAMLTACACMAFTTQSLRAGGTVSYVGMLGVVRYTIGRWDDWLVKKTEFVLFEETTGWRSDHMARYDHGIYAGTYYDYSWFNSKGNCLLKVKGRYYSLSGTPGRFSPFHLADAADTAWLTFLCDRIAAGLHSKKFLNCVVFDLGHVRVGPGYVEFHFSDDLVDGGPTRVDAHEIAGLAVTDGRFRVLHRNPNWSGSDGRFEFQYKMLRNPKLFEMALGKLLGVQLN